MLKKLGAVLALGLATINGWAQTTSGEISGTEVWSGTVELTGDITIPFGGDLTIQPGTRVLVATRDDTRSGDNADKIEIRVAGGSLKAVGTPDNRIEFLSVGDSPVSGSWIGIICSLGTFEMRQANIRHATIAINYELPGFYRLSDLEVLDCSSSAIVLSASGRYTINDVEVRSSNNSSALRCSGPNYVELNRWLVVGGGNGIYVGRGEAVLKDVTIGPGSGSGYGVNFDGTRLGISNSTITAWHSGIQIGPNGGINISLEDVELKGNKYAMEGGRKTETLSIQGSQVFGNENGITVAANTADVRDNLFRANGYGFRYDPDHKDRWAPPSRFDGKFENNFFEGNANAGLEFRTTTLVKTEVTEMSRISGNRFAENGIGLLTDLELPNEMLVGNDFSNNGITLRNRSSDFTLVADGNYWGDELTALLGEGALLSEIETFSGDISITGWSPVSTLISVEPPPSPIEWDEGLWGVTEGETATISVTLERGETFQYQWYLDGEAISGATSSRLDIENASLADAGTYTVVVSNAAGSVTSAPAVLSVDPAPTGTPGIDSDSFHPADTNQDSRISIDEVTSYGAAWKNGRNWETGPNPIPIDYLTRAGALWKNGERYRKDANVATAPLWWVNDPGANRASLQADDSGEGSKGLKRLSLDRSPTRTPLIQKDSSEGVRVTPAAGTSFWAVEYDGQRVGPFVGDQSQALPGVSVEQLTTMVMSIDGNSFVRVFDSARSHEDSAKAMMQEGRLALLPPGLPGNYIVEASSNLEQWGPASLGSVNGELVHPVLEESVSASFFRFRAIEHP